MFKKLSNSNFIPNPSKTGKTIFLSYDFVHVMKNIRNNWFNLKNLDKTFVYPDFETGLIKYAKLSDVRKIYEAEKNSIIKKAYKLNFKTLFPNSFERQKVSLVDNLFHDTTIAALKDFGFNDTADFLQLIRNWWDIVNNTSVIKGIVRRNEFSKPISNEDDDYRVKFLEKFVVWINKWHDLDSNGHLTNDTYKAFVQSTSTLLDVIRYSFTNYDIEYFLPGKFTTEKLEKRFGNYRLLNGCNYNVSLDAVLNAEKKIRVKRIFKCNRSTFSLNDIKKNFSLEMNESCSFTFDEDTLNIDKFNEIFNSNYLIECSVDESASIYIAGYGSHSASRKLDCNICLSLVVEEKGSSVDSEYFDSLQRGGLSIPTIHVRIIFLHMCAIFEVILNDSSLESNFLRAVDQKYILSKLTFLSIQTEYAFEEFQNTCLCGKDYKKILFHLLSVFANIILNDYRKEKTNSNIESKKTDSPSDSSKHLPKKRKLQTLQIV